MNRRVIAQVTFAVIVLTEFAQCQLPGSPGLTGTCASIGYSTSCCPRGGNCQPTDGGCYCGDDCYLLGDCCSDIGCPRNPRTCADVGIYQCCTDTSPGACEVRDVQHYCSCNVSCHVRGDCCSDAQQICILARQGCTADLPTLPMHDIRLVQEEIVADEVYNVILYFRCKKGYSETEQHTAICLENGTWSPNPNSMDYNCSDINECLEESVCPGDSQCINTDGSYTCSCEEGYSYVSGENLNMCIDINECVHGTHTCNNNEHADCINNEGSYTCVCKPGFVGDGESCQTIDGNTCADICDQFCIQENGSPKCACDRGYYLHSDGVSCLDINECLITYYNCSHAECVNTNGSFLCVCHPGFISYGNNDCTDKNECFTGEHNCDQNAVCINTVGSYECVCQPSFFQDGIECLGGIRPVINRTNAQVKPNHELQYTIGTDFCLEDLTSNFHLMVTCLLTRDPQPPPQFQWILALNNTMLHLSSEDTITYHYHGLSVYQENNTFTLNGTLIVGLVDSSTLDITCNVSNIHGSDRDSTSISLCGPTLCQDGVTNNCTQECSRNEVTGVHECSCRPGYEFALGSHSICEDIDECTRNTHNCSLVDRQICQNTPPGSFSCDCGPGYSGSNCEDIDECEFENFCSVSSICMNTNGSFKCVCVNGTQMDLHTGNCTDIDECLEGDHNCSQHAVCRNIDGSYICECAFGFEGNGVNCTISNRVIIGTSVTASLIVAAILLLLTITGCITILKIKSSIPKKKREYHELGVITNGHGAIARENEDSVSVSTSAMKKVELRGSLKEKLTLSFIIKSTNLRILDPIGQGEFGIVYKGYIAHKYTDEVVAIKTLKGFIDENTVEELLRECDKMKNFHHQHVMTLKGVCLDGGPVPYLILPYMANGSLLSYIRKEQTNLVIMEEADIKANNGEMLSQVYFIMKRLLDMCLQVARGMEYLASEKVVHRDLAARNCMIDINMVIKVADFGLAVHTGDKDYYRLSTNMGVKLPVMWMAPESLASCVFSEMSDVWSYGVTCWEIFTGGQAPYAGTKPSSLLSLLQDGERLETPRNSACSADMYSMMLQCWEMEPAKRPSFSALVEMLSKTLEEMAGYLHVGAFTDLDSSTRQAEQIVQQTN